MLTRRGTLSGLALIAATPALAQGKKSAGAGDSFDRLLGIDGHYRARGLNTDGNSYDGRVDIVQQSDVVEITWVIRKETVRGAGRIEGRVVTVEWGDTSPVFYLVMDDGELHGTWDDGLALEKLTPA